MMLRLVLVGIVAGLGVTIPGPPIGLGWFGSTERWANSVLADWDSWRPSDTKGERDHLAVSVHECEQCRLARAAIASRERKGAAMASSRTTKWAPVNPAPDGNNPAAQTVAAPMLTQNATVVSAFVPMEDSDDFYAGNAFELNKKAEGFQRARPATLPFAIAAETPPLAVSQDLEMDLPEVLCGATDEEVAERVFITEAAAARSAEPVISSDPLASTDTPSEPELDEMGAVDIAESAPLHLDAASARVPAAPDPSVRPKAIACDGQIAYEDATTVLMDGRDLTIYAPGSASLVVAEAPALPPLSTPAVQLSAAPVPLFSPAAIPRLEKPAQSKDPAELPWPAFAREELIVQSRPPAVQETTVPWPVFAPAEPPISRQASTATEHASAVNPPTSHEHASSRSTPGSPTDARWGHAVNLTRQAMNAWLSVLVRTAPVEVTAR